jgi:catechol 2,3-dioxygenase-like lactoylglutathione lyase family enzyme
MIDHLSTYATDYPATRRFYEAALGALGHVLQNESVATWNADWPAQRMCAFGPPRKPVFWVIEVKAPATPRHLAFTAADRTVVDSFHRAALAAGGRDNGAPGLRPQYHRNYYGAFVLDPDGNNVEAVCHAPVPVTPEEGRSD